MHILWFRRDLRLTDNECVSLACAADASVLPCFVIDPWFYERWADIGNARVRFLFESLENLDANLRMLGSQLYLFEGDAATVIKDLTKVLLEKNIGQPKLFFNRDVQVEYGIERDNHIIDFYKSLNLDYNVGLANFLQADDNHRDEWFSEYYSYQRHPIYPQPLHINTPQLSFNIPQLTFRQLKKKYRAFWQTGKVYFPGGETKAFEKLDSFLTSRFHGYHWKLSRPWLAQKGATSHLSPHLTFGTMSVRQVYQSTKRRVEELAQDPKAGFSLKAFRDRLRWHDSFSQRLYFHPEIAHTNRFREFDELYTHDELTPEKQELFRAWQLGETGFPMVDASMRQLKTMGWMNFRMRAMCATFLTINCGISWHHGAKHYMNYLVDGDLAIDNWQWQMQAGVTNPLSDTFRIYNPTKNIEERDSDLRFISYWIPELKGYSVPEIIQGAYLGRSTYPQPMLDWSETRKINGKIVSDLRKQVKQRIINEGGDELEGALATKKAVDTYWQSKDKQYQEYTNKIITSSDS